jgi:hypothetical protein
MDGVEQPANASSAMAALAGLATATISAANFERDKAGYPGANDLPT